MSRQFVRWVIPIVAISLLALGPVALAAPTHGGPGHGKGKSGEGSKVSGLAAVIVHSPTKCHVWSMDNQRVKVMSFKVRSGQKLSIVNRDVHPNQFMQVTGPRLGIGRPVIKAGKVFIITFKKAGDYRLMTVDRQLRLDVQVR